MKKEILTRKDFIKLINSKDIVLLNYEGYSRVKKSDCYKIIIDNKKTIEIFVESRE